MSEVILNLLPVTEEEKKEFEAIAPHARHVYARRRTVTREQLAEATVLFGWPRAADVEKGESLKWFQTMWAGSDEYLGHLPAGTVLTSSSGSNSRSVAEHMLALTLSLFRQIPQYRDFQLQHRWERERPLKTLLGATVLVLGTGNIGASFARMCRAMGSHTVGVKRTVTPVEGFDEIYPMAELDRLLPRADVVALILPGTAETAGLMGEEQLRSMKDDAVLISCGRGSVLDLNALARVMGEGKLWGAGLDVTDPEPLPSDHPIWDIPNVMLTPHTAGSMLLELTRRTCIEQAQANLRRYLAGEQLKNYVTTG